MTLRESGSLLGARILAQLQREDRVQGPRLAWLLGNRMALEVPSPWG